MEKSKAINIINSKSANMNYRMIDVLRPERLPIKLPAAYIKEPYTMHVYTGHWSFKKFSIPFKWINKKRDEVMVGIIILIIGGLLWSLLLKYLKNKGFPV